MRAVFHPPASMASVALAPRAVSSEAKPDAPGVPCDPPVDAGGPGGRAERGRPTRTQPAPPGILAEANSAARPGAFEQRTEEHHLYHVNLPEIPLLSRVKIRFGGKRL